MKKSMRCGFAAAVLCAAVMFCGAPAYAAGEAESSAAYLAERGIFEGDGNGGLNLDKSLARAELAVILTRLEFIDGAQGGLGEWREWGAAHFADPENRYNKFTDVPEWALPYVEYCYQRGLMKGVAPTLFDPRGEVNPKMACTVILRYCGVAETDWSYDDSVAKAQSLGIAPGDGVDGDELLRGTMAVIVRRGMEYGEAAPAARESAPDTPGGLPAGNSAPGSIPSPAQAETPAMTVDEMKAEIVRLTNGERAKAGLNPVEVLPELMDCAQAKADDLIDNHYFVHTSPRYGTIGEMIMSFVPKATSYAENLGGWAMTPGDAVQGWVASKGHYSVIVNSKYTHIGVGIVKGADGGYWWVQQFVRIP
jgi:uncharacterized protein YkwD